MWLDFRLNKAAMMRRECNPSKRDPGWTDEDSAVAETREWDSALAGPFLLTDVFLALCEQLRQPHTQGHQAVWNDLCLQMGREAWTLWLCVQKCVCVWWSEFSVFTVTEYLIYSVVNDVLCSTLGKKSQLLEIQNTGFELLRTVTLVKWPLGLFA